MAHKVHVIMQQRPIMTAAAISDLANTSFPTANNALSNLERLGILTEITGKDRGRIYAYTRYLDILNEGTEPLR